jgi:beta-glucanase (GH16 family)
MPQLVDSETPHNARTRTGFDGQKYNLVFSDEFNTDGRTFWPGDGPFHALNASKSDTSQTHSGKRSTYTVRLQVHQTSRILTPCRLGNGRP